MPDADSSSQPSAVRPEACLLVVCGLVASGKSSVAERLAERLGAERIGADETRRALFEAGESADLDLRQRAIVKFASKLSSCPSGASRADLEGLADCGLSPAEILDVILSVSVFAWANRLMHTLGDPVAHPL